MNKNSTIKIVKHYEWDYPNKHSESANYYLSEIFKDFPELIEKLNLISVGIGPGSFTGIRIAVNIARALGYSYKIPIIPVSSPEILAWQVFRSQAFRTQDFQHKDLTFLCLQNAFKNCVFATAYTVIDAGSKNENLKKIFGTISLPISEVINTGQILKRISREKFFIVGDADRFFPKELLNLKKSPYFLGINSIDTPSAKELFRTSLRSNLIYNTLEWKNLKPLYIKASSAEENLRSGVLKPIKMRQY